MLEASGRLSQNAGNATTDEDQLLALRGDEGLATAGLLEESTLEIRRVDRMWMAAHRTP